MSGASEASDVAEPTTVHALHFDEIAIQRMPGIPNGFKVDGLSPGINIIFGPNAAGKTTLVRAVNALLWPPRAPSDAIGVSARFQMDGRGWRLAVDGALATCERDGQPVDSPVAAAGDGRYLLALHDLLAADNQDFAAHIARESSGGYDISAAIVELAFVPKPRPSNATVRALQHARGERIMVRQASAALVDDERRLQRLRTQLEDGQRAADLISPLTTALDYQTAVEDHERAATAVERFPDACARLRSDTLESLANVRDMWEKARELQRAEQQSLSDAQLRRATTHLPDAGLPTGLLAQLRARVDELLTLAAEMQHQDDLMRAARAEQDRARAAIGNAVDDERLATLTVGDVSAFANLADRLEKASAELRGLDALLEWLAPLPLESQADEIERLGMGVSQLHQWLRQGQPTSVPSQVSSPATPWLFVLTIVAILEAIVLAIVAHPALIALAIIPITLLVLHRRAGQTPVPVAPRSDDPRVPVMEAYGRLNLEMPARWERASVETLTDALSLRRAAMRVSEDKRQRWHALPAQRERVRQQLEALRAERAAALVAFGLPPGSATVTLVALAGLVAGWQAASMRLEGADAVRAATEQRQRDLQSNIACDLTAYGYAAVATPADAVGALADFAQREREASDADLAIERAQRRIRDQLEPESQRHAAAVTAFFTYLDLADGDDAALHELFGQYAEWQKARQHLLRSDAALAVAEQRLGMDTALTDVPGWELLQRRSSAEQAAQEREQLRGEISAIDARIDAARQRSDLEQAITHEERQLDRLRDNRAENQATAAGWLLADFIRAHTRDRDRPKVFHRARELFKLITQGRYHLEMSESDPPRFHALDTTTGAGHTLDELSSGTRLQLLISVRIAFVEQQELGPKLPLLLDETLGNSDERRAQAIIDAAILLARDGRQIFYLTAQHDEVDKWRNALAEDQVDHKLIDLVAVRHLAEADRLPLEARQRHNRLASPAPNGHDRQVYSALIGVPDIDPYAPLGAMHLWHLLDDLDVLHHLLNQGVGTWGQLDALFSVVSSALPDHENVLANCRVRARIAEVVLECWRVGRGRPVDRVALRQSGQITDTFFERVRQLADDLDGDAAALVQALYIGRVDRFRRTAVVDLNTWFEEHGYIDSSPVLHPAEAHARALAVARGNEHATPETDAWISTLVTVLWREEAH